MLQGQKLTANRIYSYCLVSHVNIPKNAKANKKIGLNDKKIRPLSRLGAGKVVVHSTPL
jgi:hypothetical protein